MSLSLRFAGVVKRACLKTGMRTVILVDEYDKPLLQAITDPELQDRYRNTLKPFYGVLKSMDGYIKFALLTGVTKFGKISVFSDLKHLRHHRKGAPGQFQRRHPRTGRRKRTELRPGLRAAEGGLRRIPFLRELHRAVQPVQPAEYIQEKAVRTVLV